MENLIAKMEEGRYAVPDVQRPYVWKNQQVLELFNSMYQNLPIGSILVWNMPRELVEDYGDFFRPLVDELEDKRQNFQYLIIDGQQRLVSIYLARRGYATIEGENRLIALYFNPTATSDENRFKLAYGKELEKNPNWFKVSDILMAETIGEILEKKAEVSGDKNIIGDKKLERELQKFKSTILQYPVHIYEVPEKALPYKGDLDNFPEILEKISEMFVRLNSTGTRIKMTHLMMAILTAETRKARESFKEKVSKFDESLRKEYGQKWDIREPVLMRTYLAIATGSTGFKEAKSKLENMNADNILHHFERTEKCLKEVIKMFSEDLNIKEVRFLKSQYSLVPVAFYLSRKETETFTLEDIQLIRRWLLLSSFSERYTGRLESDLKEDIRLISEGKSWKDLESQLTVKEITESLLDNVCGKEHLTALSMLLAESWDLSSDRKKISELKEVAIHHIFPKDVLRKVYGKEVGEMDIETACEQVGNITITSKEANEKIGSTRPDEYLSKFSEKILESHCIPTDPELWKPENYKNFIAKRKELLLQKIKELTLV